MLYFFSRDVLDEILDLIWPVSEGLVFLPTLNKGTHNKSPLICIMPIKLDVRLLLQILRWSMG